jgi:hypothetical protein
MNIVQVAQHAEDLGRAAEFYTRLTGSGPTGRFEPPGLLFFDLGGVRLLLEQGALPATFISMWTRSGSGSSSCGQTVWLSRRSRT